MNEGLPRAAAMLQYKLIHSLTHTYNTEDAKKNQFDDEVVHERHTPVYIDKCG